MKYKTIDELGEIRKRCGVSYYHQLYTLLSAALNEGLIAPGSALPSESELMQRFGVSRNTVRRAVGQLEQEKRVVCRRGSGSYARSAPQTAELSPAVIAEVLHDFEDEESSSRLLRVQSAATPAFIRRKDPQFGEKSLLVQRCRSYKDEPFMFTTSYVPESVAGRLTRRQLTRHVVLTALDASGVKPSSADEVTTAVTADAFTARHLGVELASALLCVHRLVRDDVNRSIEHQSHLFRPDRSPLRARIAIERSGGALRWSPSKTRAIPAAL
jgi:GntR family transcriptional regulator